MDELLEKEKNIRGALANRSGVLALLLHSTYNHEVMEKLQRQNQEQEAMKSK